MRNTLPIVLLLFSSCFLFEEDEKDEQNTNLTLSLHSAGVTTVNLNVSPEDSLAEFTFELTRDDSTVQTLSLQSDTLIKDTGLNPNITYTYKGYWKNGTERIGASDSLTVTTMDTTSHNFIWEIDTLGIYGSYLNDVAVIDENNIWAVGRIRMLDPDSSFNGTGREDFNAAHWNGSEWELILIGVPGVIGEGIFYFSENDIWVAAGIIYHWNGEEWERFHLWDMGVLGHEDGIITKVWGSEPDNLYFVGREGTIVHYDGSDFEQIESGNDVLLLDVEGSIDGEYVFMVGIDFFSPAYSTALQIHEGSVETLYYSEVGFPDNANEWGAISSVSIYEDTAYFVTYQGLWKYNYVTLESTVDPAFSNYGYRHMVVQAPNDIFMVGGGGDYTHFNGASWDFNDALYNNYALSTVWGGGDLKGDITVMAGHFRDGSHGFVAIGRR